MSDEVRLSIDSGVATIAFNRPAALNALNEAAIVSFSRSCESVERDRSVRCVILRGEGDAFLAGGDVTLFAQRLDDLAQLSRQLTRELHNAILALRRMEKPVIASVHGAVAGAGISVMAACDVIVAADDARFIPGYGAIGTSPDGGATYFLARCLGPRIALEFLLLAEPIDAARAFALGLVNRVVPRSELVAATQTLAQRLASGPTFAFAHTKRLIESANATALPAQLDAESLAFSACAASDDMREGVRAFVEKRPPRFIGR